MANKSYQNYQNKKNKNIASQKGIANKSASEKANVKTETNTKTNKETVKLGEIKNKNQDNQSKKTESEKQNNASQKNEQKEQSKSNNTQISKPKTKNDKVRHAVGAIILIGSTLVVGGLAALLGGRMQDGLEKPPAYPPDWLFPVMWSIFYIAIGIAAYLAYFSVKNKKQRITDLVFYGIHLFFNLFWSMFFFRLNMMIFATIWLAFVLITAIIVTYRYYKANLASGIIFTAYSLWLLFAMYLSLATTIINLKG